MMFPSPRSTSDLIADRLRLDIAAGRYTDGEPLRQDELASRFGVSKIPVREALQQLKSEGLVASHRNRGSMVVGASSEEVAEVYAMRQALELLALRAALPLLTDADLLRADGALHELGAVTDPAEWPRLNWEFHAALYQPARMPTLLRTLESLHHSVARYLLIYLTEESHQKASQNEHHELLEACRSRNLTHAEQVLIRHLENASAESQAFINSQTNRRNT